MAWFTRLSRFTRLAIILAVALTLGLATNAPAQVQAQLNPNSLSSKLPNQWEFNPPSAPGDSLPTNREGAATRGDEESCIQRDESLIALVPASGIGKTTAEYPTFSWYMPSTSASAIEFLLRDAKGQSIYRAQYALVKSALSFSTATTQEPRVGIVSASRIMSLTLPPFANLSPLEIGQEYNWSLALICDPSERAKDIVAEGALQRVQPNPTLALRIQQATPEARVALYADARLWYETLNTLVELRRDRPKDNDLTHAWNKLLKSVGLDKISI